MTSLPRSDTSPVPKPLAVGGEAQALALFAAALFVGAGLVFWIQSLFTKMVLPMFGGSPTVWNTAMVFFQTGVLAGYAYADLLARYPRPT